MRIAWGVKSVLVPADREQKRPSRQVGSTSESDYCERGAPIRGQSEHWRRVSSGLLFVLLGDGEGGSRLGRDHLTLRLSCISVGEEDKHVRVPRVVTTK